LGTKKKNAETTEKEGTGAAKVVSKRQTKAACNVLIWYVAITDSNHDPEKRCNTIDKRQGGVLPGLWEGGRWGKKGHIGFSVF